jgi:carboxymethylenebutenolidase
LPGSTSGLTRRELLAAGVAAAGYAAAAGPVSAAAIHTPDDGLEAGMVEVPSEGAALRAYRARPQGDAQAPPVLVVHEIFGLHEYIRDVCRRLARDGYMAVAPDLYQRQGDPARLDGVEAILEQIVARVPDAQVMADLDATLDWARGHGGQPFVSGITGFCWGGRIVWLYAAHQPLLTAGVAWYGRLAGDVREQTPRHPMDLDTDHMAPVLGLYGGADRGIPLETIFEMRKKLTAHEIDIQRRSEIMIFPTAPHGFHADYRDSYRELDAREGWRRMLEWFHRHGLVGIPFEEGKAAADAAGGDAAASGRRE